MTTPRKRPPRTGLAAVLLTAFLTSAAWGQMTPGLVGVHVFPVVFGQVGSAYGMANAGDTAVTIPYFSGEALITIVNLEATAQTISIEYRDLSGTDRTPVTNTHTVPGDGTIRWAPLINNPAVEGLEGSSVPDMTGNATAGSAIIVGEEALAGIVEARSSDGSTSAYLLAGFTDIGTTVAVPYFGTNSLFAIQNVGTSTANVTVEYRGLDGTSQTPATDTFEVAVNGGVRWGPLLSDSLVEGAAGVAVPDMTGGAAEGSALIVSTQPIAAQVEHGHGASSNGYTLVHPNGSSHLFAPYINRQFDVQSHIAVQNVGGAQATVVAVYRDLAGPLVGDDFLTLGVNESSRFVPDPDDGGAGSGDWNGEILSDQPLIAYVATTHDGGEVSSYRAWEAGEESQTLSVPYFRTGSFFTVQNVSNDTATVTVTYRDSSGVDRTPSSSTFELPVGKSARWSPFPSGAKVDEFPTITGDVDDGSAIVTSTQPLVGLVELGKAFEPEDVNGDGEVNAVDIQLVVNAALGLPVAENCDANGDGDVDAVDIQLVVNKALGI